MRLAASMIAMPRPPLWERKPIGPGGGGRSVKVALRRTSGAVLITPRQLGPIRRVPPSRQMLSSSRCRAAPSSPLSVNPAEITSRALAPAWVHSRATSHTCAAGTAITARSTFSGSAATEGYAFWPAIVRTRRLTA